MNVAAGKYLSPSQKIAWLRLVRTPNVGPQTFRQLINRTGSAEAAIDDEGFDVGDFEHWVLSGQ